MLTTRQLVDRLRLAPWACKEGCDYADAHPDPMEAIDFALADCEGLDCEEEFGGGPRAFLRWAASDPAVSGAKGDRGLCGVRYLDLDDWWVPDHLARCADLLRAWVREQIALEETR